LNALAMKCLTFTLSTKPGAAHRSLEFQMLFLGEAARVDLTHRFEKFGAMSQRLARG